MLILQTKNLILYVLILILIILFVCFNLNQNLIKSFFLNKKKKKWISQAKINQLLFTFMLTCAKVNFDFF